MEKPDKRTTTARFSAANVGRILDGKYRLEQDLGGGDMGRVYKATNMSLEKVVAIKLLDAQSMASEDYQLRFEREVKTSIALSNPHTVKVYDYNISAEGEPYIVMEYVKGSNLLQKVKIEGPLGLARAVRIARQVAQSLVEAHSIGLVHRDLKPSNIMLMDVKGHHDFVKLLDFGIAKFIQQEENDEVTKKGTTIGTPMYMAPEQIVAPGKVSPAADIYSLGLTLYFMLTGNKPSDETTSVSIMVKRLKGKVPPLPGNMKIPIELRDLYKKMTQKNPKKRPSAEDVVDILEDLEIKLNPKTTINEIPISTTITTLTHQLLSYGYVKFILLFILLLLGAYLIWPSRKKRMISDKKSNYHQLTTGKGTPYQENGPLAIRGSISPVVFTALRKPVLGLSLEKQIVKLKQKQASEYTTVTVITIPQGAKIYNANTGAYLGKGPLRVKKALGRSMSVLVKKSGFYPARISIGRFKKGNIVIKLKQVRIELPL